MLMLVEKIEQKLDEYDIEIFDKYEVENEYTLIVEDMILFVNGKDSISVAFQVSTKPEVVASNMGILYEIKEIKKLAIMESFVITKGQEFVSGEEAYNLFNKTIEHKIIRDFETEKYYKMVLLSSKGYQC